MILFKSCTRCGGDVDTTYDEDVYCVQCGHRPAVQQLGSRMSASEVEAPEPGTSSSVKDDVGGYVDRPLTACPRCDSGDAVELSKLRPGDNTCYRCQRCAYIYSPRVPRRQVGS